MFKAWLLDSGVTTEGFSNQSFTKNNGTTVND